MNLVTLPMDFTSKIKPFENDCTSVALARGKRKERALFGQKEKPFHQLLFLATVPWTS